MLAAVKARGVTVIEDAAKEPHVGDLANFLNPWVPTYAGPVPTSSKSGV